MTIQVDWENVPYPDRRGYVTAFTINRDAGAVGDSVGITCAKCHSPATAQEYRDRKGVMTWLIQPHSGMGRCGSWTPVTARYVKAWTRGASNVQDDE